jgi:hypothetical protein
MLSKLLIIAALVDFALPTSVAIAGESDNQGEGPWADSDFVLTRPSPLSDINENILVIPPQVDAHTTCRQGFGTGAQDLPIRILECTSIRVAPDPKDCPPGETLIMVWRGFGNVSHVCGSARANEDAR